jgi:xanthine dehydrogenase YagR molybdenum-binding subunit
MARKFLKTIIEFEGEEYEIEALLPEIEAPTWKKDEKLKIVGKPTPRIDGVEKITGEAKFTHDVNLPNMLYGKILRCPLPHARIKKIDTSKAEKLPGVKAVLKLDKKEIRYAGEEIAAVAAVDELTANEAIKLINVEYEELPFVVTIEDALKPNAPKVRPEGNIGRAYVNQRGDVEAGFREADVVIEQTYKTQVEIHQPLESHGTVAKWDGDKLTVWESTQGIFAIRRGLAKALNIPEDNIRVIKQHMGGGFGSKLWHTPQTIICAKLAKMTGRPVKIILDRKEQSISVGNRPSAIMHVRIGAKRDGKLTAIYLKAYSSGGITGGDRVGTVFREIYACPNVKTEEYHVYINACPKRPTRAPGFVQGIFALESAMDELAEKLGMNPLDLRMKNYTTRSAGGTGKPYSTKGLDKCYKLGAERINWYRYKPENPSPFKKRGIGMATGIWGGAGGPGPVVDIKISKDGQVNVFCGTQDIGTGTRTIIAQVVAEELGLDVSDINVNIGDTNLPYAPSSGGSATAPSVAPAARNAAYDAKMKLFKLAGKILNASEDELKTENRKVFYKDKSISWTEVFESSNISEITGRGRRAPNNPDYAYNSFAAHFAEVEVDLLTGQVKVLKVVAAHEFGRVINPLTAENQIIGGVTQGMSYALTEQRIMDRKIGRMVNADMENYKVFTPAEMPVIEPIIVNMPDPILNNIGLKGVGEPPRIPTAAAIANAIYNAIGVRIRELPITPDKILLALEEKNKRRKR